MPQFKYTVVLASGGGERSGLITASTEADARKALSMQIKIKEWISMNPVPESVPEPSKLLQKKKSGPQKIQATPVSPAKRPLRKLDQLIEKQNGRCFFCDELLPRDEASIEHLVAISHGGKREDRNEVACHRTINQKMGDIPLKDKFEFILKVPRDSMCGR